MKKPISIYNNDTGEIEVFASVEEAESSIEPIDVEHGEYIATDANGLRLSIDVIIEERPLLWGFWKNRIKKVQITRVY